MWPFGVFTRLFLFRSRSYLFSTCGVMFDIAAGVTATSAVCGSNAPTNKTNWSPLAGKRVLIWPDNDLPGLSYAQNAAQAVLAAGALSVGILPIPQGKSGGWDAADAVDEGMDVRAYVEAAMPEPVVPPAAAMLPA